MTEDRYRMIAELIGQALRELRCEPISITDRSGDEQKALYVVVNQSGYICYGGKTSPMRQSEAAASKRMQYGHMTEQDKRADWAAYWVFPLEPETSEKEVRRLEKAMVAQLGISLVKKRR